MLSLILPRALPGWSSADPVASSACLVRLRQQIWARSFSCQMVLNDAETAGIRVTTVGLCLWLMAWRPVVWAPAVKVAAIFI